jgi:hypothetical protein
MQLPVTLTLALSLAGAPIIPISPTLISAAAPESAATPPSRATLDQIYTDAQMHVERYNGNGDQEQLRSARSLLDEWLRGHAQLYGYSEQAVAARAPVQQQVAAIDDKLGPPAGSEPASAPAAQAPAPTPVPADIVRRQRRSNTMLTTGLVLGGLGLATVLFLALPAYGLRNNALDNAKGEEFYVDEQIYIDRARRRHNVMIGAFAVGGAFFAGGTALVIAGAVGKNRANNDLAFAPALGPSFAGGSMRLRF